MDLSSLFLIAPQLLLSLATVLVLRMRSSSQLFARFRDSLVATGILAAVLIAILAWIMYVDSGNRYSLMMLAGWFVVSCLFAIVWPILQCRQRRKLNDSL